MNVLSKISKLLISRSKIHIMRRYFLVAIGCFFLSIASYYFLDKILYSLHNSWIKTIDYTSNCLINFGFATDKISIKGNKIIKNIEITKLIDTQHSIMMISLSNLKERILKEHSWLKNIVIKRLLPNKLEIIIDEYQPFANHYNNNKKSVIDDTGHIIIEDSKIENIISIYGNIKSSDLVFIKTILKSNNDISTLISSFARINNRRWNIIFSSGLEVKLPEIDPYNSWDYLLHLYETSHSFLNWKVIDMRIANKIFIKK